MLTLMDIPMNEDLYYKKHFLDKVVEQKPVYKWGQTLSLYDL